MNSDYILPKLIKWAELFYGEKRKPYCFAEKEGKDYYFGWRKGKKHITNTISKEVAIYLSIPDVVPKPEITEEEVLTGFKEYLKNQTPYRREKVIHKFSKFVKKNKK